MKGREHKQIEQGREGQDRRSTDQTSVYTLIRKSFRGVDSEPMPTPRGKSPLPSDLKIGTPVATLPGAWRYRVSAGTGRPGVSIL